MPHKTIIKKKKHTKQTCKLIELIALSRAETKTQKMIGWDCGVLWFSPQKLIWLTFDVGKLFFLSSSSSGVYLASAQSRWRRKSFFFVFCFVFVLLESQMKKKKNVNIQSNVWLIVCYGLICIKRLINYWSFSIFLLTNKFLTSFSFFFLPDNGTQRIFFLCIDIKKIYVFFWFNIHFYVPRYL